LPLPPTARLRYAARALGVMTIPVTPARPSPVPAPVVECVYIGEVCPRLPAPLVVEAEGPRATIVMGVRLGWVVGSTPAPSYRY
jgi:hypothetical protein